MQARKSYNRLSYIKYTSMFFEACRFIASKVWLNWWEKFIEEAIIEHYRSKLILIDANIKEGSSNFEKVCSFKYRLNCFSDRLMNLKKWKFLPRRKKRKEPK